MDFSQAKNRFSFTHCTEVFLQGVYREQQYMPCVHQEFRNRMTINCLSGYLGKPEHRLRGNVRNERLNQLCQSIPRPPCFRREVPKAFFCLKSVQSFNGNTKLKKINTCCRGRYSKVDVKKITGCDFCWFSFNFDNHLRFRNYSRVNLINFYE